MYLKYFVAQFYLGIEGKFYCGEKNTFKLDMKLRLTCAKFAGPDTIRCWTKNKGKLSFELSIPEGYFRRKPVQRK